jgi:hypothetical protein
MSPQEAEEALVTGIRQRSSCKRGVIILNSGKELPLAIKVGDKYVEIPSPSS